MPWESRSITPIWDGVIPFLAILEIWSMTLGAVALSHDGADLLYGLAEREIPFLLCVHMAQRNSELQRLLLHTARGSHAVHPVHACNGQRFARPRPRPQLLLAVLGAAVPHKVRTSSVSCCTPARTTAGGLSRAAARPVLPVTRLPGHARRGLDCLAAAGAPRRASPAPVSQASRAGAGGLAAADCGRRCQKKIAGAAAQRVAKWGPYP
jgi:hypothetical protein